MQSFASDSLWLFELCNEPTSRNISKSANPLIELDSAEAIARATHYLQHNAPRALAYAGGNDTTYRVAARVRDFGLSEAQALESISEHWNEAGKAEPPWDPAELQTIIGNAYAYATAGWGGLSGLADFGDMPVEILERPKSTFEFNAEWITAFDPTQIPKRAWLLGRFLALGYVTGLIAPPGAGKTTLELTMAVSLASGKNILGFPVEKRCRVFVWNQEDELDELRRRLAAILKAFNLTFDDITLEGQPAILLGSGADRALMLATRNGAGKIVAAREVETLIETFLETGIAAAMFDPLVEMHGADENNNVEMGAVARVFRMIAVRARCAVLIVHHTRKAPTGDSTGHIGNMESGRGGGSLFGVTRIGATLYTIDDKTAGEYGVPADERHRYVRLDGAKNNMALTGGEPLFFRREGVNIGTFEDPEDVGVLRPIALVKRKPKGAMEADAMTADLDAVLADAPSIKIADAARHLIDIDSISYGEHAPTVVRRICRNLEAGKLSGFVLQKGERKQDGNSIVRAIGHTENVSDESDG